MRNNNNTRSEKFAYIKNMQANKLTLFAAIIIIIIIIIILLLLLLFRC